MLLVKMLPTEVLLHAAINPPDRGAVAMSGGIRRAGEDGWFGAWRGGFSG